eukprot:RCo025339
MKWVVGVDGSSASQKAIARLATLARDGDEVSMFHCFTSPSASLAQVSDQQSRKDLVTHDLSKLDTAASEQAKDVLREAKETYSILHGRGKVQTVLEQSADCKSKIVDWCDNHKIDSIVLGNRSLSQMERWLMGSVSRFVVLHSQYSSVLVVK